jgi:hypothetical protein
MTPLSKRHINALDPGIRLTVQWLREHSFETTDSGDGVSKAELIREGYALGMPHVFIQVEPFALLSESRRLRDLLLFRGLRCESGAIQAMYDPADGVAIIALYDINDDAFATAKPAKEVG